MAKVEFKLGPASSKEIERAMLDRVLSIAGEDEYRVADAIETVICEQRDPARRGYLRRLLRRKAREKIRRKNAH